MTDRRAVVWRSTPVRLALAAFPLWVTTGVIVLNTPWRTKLLVGSVFALSAAAPAYGLLLIAGLTPFGRYLEFGLHIEPFRVSESIVLAFLAGWLIRPTADRSGPRTPAGFCWALAAVIGVSVVSQLWRAAAQNPDAIAELGRIIRQAYFIVPDNVGFQAAARLFEGLALIAAVTVVRRDNRRVGVMLPAALVGGALGAAAASFLVTRGLAPPTIAAEYALQAPRTSAIVGDVNAAASYFGMTMLAAFGMAARRRSIGSIGWAAAALVLAWALWVTGSRSGVAAAALLLAAAVTFTAAGRMPPRVRLAVLCVVIIAAAAGAVFRARGLQHDEGAEYRRAFTAVSARMIASRPIAGVGIGQYRDASPMFMSPFLGWTYGLENAHNYFLQIAAELGVFGLITFGALLAVVLARGTMTLVHEPADTRLLGCLAGATAFLATSLVGHPLLLDEVAFPFWMVFGLVASLGGGRGPATSDENAPRWSSGLRIAAIAGGLVAMGAAMTTARRPIVPSDSPDVTGVEPWQTAPDGTRYRWTHGYASVFVPRDLTRVYIPIRLPAEAPQVGTWGVNVRADGGDLFRSLVGAFWGGLDVALPQRPTWQAYRRIDLKIDRIWNADGRQVGIQLGEPKPAQK